MARRLGELLVAKGKLSSDQLQKALQAQMIWGGHLGTNLIELGYLTEDELGEVLAEAHAVRYATYEMLQEIPASVLASIPKGLVEKYKIVPFRFDGKRLHLVMLSPQDLTALDEVSFATGFQLVPYVTPEIRLFQILEKYYNIPRTKRYITLSRELSVRQARHDAAAGRIAGAGREAMDRPRPHPSILDSGSRPAPSARPSREASVERRPEETAGDPIFRATAATDWTPGAGRPAPALADQETPPEPSSELVPEPLEENGSHERHERILDRLLRSRSLAEVCSCLIEEAAGTFRRCAVFSRSGDSFVSVGGLCTSSPSWSFEGLWLPLTPAAAEVLFGNKRTYYLGPPPGGLDDGPFYEKFGGKSSASAFLAPVRLNERIALLFYGDDLDEEIRPREVEGILTMLQQASLALDLLALRRKDSPL